jgi:hypothetical protein
VTSGIGYLVLAYAAGLAVLWGYAILLWNASRRLGARRRHERN